ncbi:MAG TPA: PA14 domain-containing protein, partial [Ohtaekwangia sp.]|nr:PA14 domain-containing protein [Ohtaekwangia sp.]
GLNFGWPTAEGNNANPDFTNPVYTYQHAAGDGKGCAVTGGVFFNPSSTNYPAQYQGRYFFQDFCNRWINMLDLTTSPVTRLPFATNLGNQSLSLDVGTDGNLYYLERSSGSLFKIIYTSNNAPAIVSHPANVTVPAGQPASFSVSATGAAPLSYQWQRNGQPIQGATSATYSIANAQPSHAGSYRVVVSNQAGSITSNTAQLTVTTFNGAPVAQIITPQEGSLYRGGEIISFSGNGTDPEDGTLPASAFTWFVDFYHDTHHHDGPPVASGVKSGTFTVPVSGETSDNVWYRINLVVRDSQGLQDTVFRDVLPRKSTITLASQPPGLQVTLDGQPFATPFSDLSVEGIERSIGVVSPQTFNGQSYTFDRWLHGGAASQTISTPINNVTYTAVFTVNALRAPENPANTESGLVYEYYEGTWNTLPDFFTLTPVESGNINTVNLWPRNREDDYAFRFTGYLQVPANGTYTFYTTSDEGSQLLIGSTVVVNNNGLHTAQEASGTIGLQSGKHAFTVTFFERTGAASIATRYAGPGINKRVIPSTAFYRLVTAPSLASAARLETGSTTDRGYLTVYPNPTSNEINFDVLAEAGDAVDATLINLHGQVIKQQLYPSLSEGLNILTLTTDEISDGLYQLRILERNGPRTARIIIKK